MSDVTDPSAPNLNQSCFCITLDRGALAQALDTASGEPGFQDRFATNQPHLFSNVPVFLPAATLSTMQQIIAAIEQVAQIPAYRDAVLGWAPRPTSPAPIMWHRRWPPPVIG